jgi:hypothetical protein
MKLEKLLREALRARTPEVKTPKPSPKPTLWVLGAAIHEFAKLHYANNRYAKVIR